MDREQIIKEFYNPLRAQITALDKKLDMFITMLNDKRKAETSENDAAIVELAELVSEMEVE